MQNRFRESNQIAQRTNMSNYLFEQREIADVSIFQRYLLTKFQGSRNRFYEILLCYVTMLFNHRLVTLL